MGEIVVMRALKGSAVLDFRRVRPVFPPSTHSRVSQKITLVEASNVRQDGRDVGQAGFIDEAHRSQVEREGGEAKSKVTEDEPQAKEGRFSETRFTWPTRRTW